MKVNKKQGLLFIFYGLLSESGISKEEMMLELEISENSFWKYIQEIRAFASNFYLSYEIKYNRRLKRYFLSKS